MAAIGDPKRQRKKYAKPANPWRVDSISEELRLVGEYGLRNKRELWRTVSRLRKYRTLARSLFRESPEKRSETEKVILGKMNRLALLPSNAVLDDVLKLSVRDFLERRLQTVVYRLGLASSLYHARQLVSHGHVFIAEKKVRTPSYHVLVGEDTEIKTDLQRPANAAAQSE